MSTIDEAAQQRQRIAAIYRYIYGNWNTMILYVYAELGVADILAEAPTGIAQIAEQTGTDPAAMGRILQCAGVLGLHEVDPETGALELTGLGALLREGVPGSLRAAARLNGAPYRYAPWGQLLDYARNGSGKGLSPTWEEGSLPYLQQHPDLLAVFEQAMTDLSRATLGDIDENQVIAESLDWTPYRRVMDVGGGNGALISAIVAHNPHLEGVLFDLPEVVAQTHLPESGTPGSGQVGRLGGDFFECVPAGFDLYTMKNVIHNAPEERCVRLLVQTRRALQAEDPDGPPASAKRLILFEMILSDEGNNAITKLMNLNMNLLVGGVSRTVADFEDLFEKSGLALESIADLPGLERKIITARLSN
jgi:hypothetical protein